MKQGFLGTRLCPDVFINELWRIQQQQARKLGRLKNLKLLIIDPLNTHFTEEGARRCYQIKHKTVIVTELLIMSDLSNKFSIVERALFGLLMHFQPLPLLS